MAGAPVCPKCGGVGWIIVERSSISGAQPCDCRSEERKSHLEERAQIPPLYANASFDGFKLPGLENPLAHRDLQKALMDVRNYASGYPAVPKPGLLLIGDQGCGKTHLAVAAIRRLMEREHECLFCDYQTLLDNIRAGFDSTSGWAEKEAYKTALDVEVLLIDDLGAHRGNAWVEDTITSIITHRCNHRKALIATTNLPDADAGSNIMEKSETGPLRFKRTLAEGIGPRARSRLFEMCTVVRIPPVDDYRVKKAKKP